MRAKTDAEFRAFLQDLADSKVVRVVGSYAKGTQNTGDHISDLDLYVLRDTEGMKKVIEIYDKHGVVWESVTVGSIGSPRNAFYLPIPVEASYLFNCQRRRVFKLKIFGVEFVAYEQNKESA